MMTIAEPLAHSGVAWAKSTVASLFHLGLGVPRDLNKAEVLYLEAYEAGDELAMINLVSLYEISHNQKRQTNFDKNALPEEASFLVRMTRESKVRRAHHSAVSNS